MRKLLALVLAICLTVAIAVPAFAYNDVNSNMWYSKAVDFCTSNGYMTGTGNNNFAPNGKVSRAQMAQILYNFSNQPDMSDAENPFSDVKRDAWYANAVLFCKSTDIVSGTSATTYSPNAYVTREQVCKMLMGYYAKSTQTTPSVDLSVLNSYTDKTKISNWAQDSVAWAIQNKIMSGTGNNKLDPKGTCTRAQLAQFIMNYFNAFGKIPPIELPDEPDPILPNIPGFPEDGHFEPIPEDWLPVGGYWQGDRKYNMYGIDITGVDGVPMADEIHIMELINNYRVQNGLPELKWSRYAQVMSEVRARESSYIYQQMNSSNPVEIYTGAHCRPDKTDCFDHEAHTDNYTENCIACQKGIGKNTRLIEELKGEEIIIDPDMAAINKIVKPSQQFSAVAENLGYTSSSQMLPQSMLNIWINSPGHDAALKADFDRFDCNLTGYFAVAQDTYIDNVGRTIYNHSYDAFGIEWVQPTEIDPSDPTEWYPGKGVNYDQLGFTIDDIPDEYTDWIERELDMTPEEYGPADHTAEAVTWWLCDHGIEEDSNYDVQIEAHYYANMEMDDYIKFAISKTDWMHWTMIDADTLASSPAWEIPTYKAELVEMVADKLAYNHFVRKTDSTGDYGCHVCLQDHTEKRDLNAAESIVNQFFMTTYGFDISAY